MIALAISPLAALIPVNLIKVGRSHPAVRDELQARAFVVKTLEKLGINFEAVKPPGRPPSPIGWSPRVA